jgi:hypothetical protein
MKVEYRTGLGEYLDELGISWRNESEGDEQYIRIIDNMTPSDIWNLAMAYRNWCERYVDHQP